MQDENVILPDFVIADLYKNHLIEPLEYADVQVAQKPIVKKQAKEENKVSNLSFQFLGENKKGIVIIVNEREATYINDDDLAFLSKVLSACNFNLSDIAILNINTTQLRFDALKQELNAAHILLMGVEPAAVQLPFTVPQFQVQQFAGCTILSTPPLSSMMLDNPESISLKRQLWTSLQKVFKLK